MCQEAILIFTCLTPTQSRNLFLETRNLGQELIVHLCTLEWANFLTRHFLGHDCNSQVELRRIAWSKSDGHRYENHVKAATPICLSFVSVFHSQLSNFPVSATAGPGSRAQGSARAEPGPKGARNKDVICNRYDNVMIWLSHITSHVFILLSFLPGFVASCNCF